MKNKFTLCSLVFNNADYLLFQEQICRKLATDDYTRIVIDSSEIPEEREKLKTLKKTQIIDGRYLNKFTGSEAHGAAVNRMMEVIDSKYALILDLDIVPLVKGWDNILKEQLQNKVDIIGVPYNPLHKNRRMQNIPTVFFMAYNVNKINNLKLDWRTIPTKYRLILYKLDHYMQKIFKIKPIKFFDFEMGQFALKKIRKSNLRYKSFEMVQPWESNAKLKFDISAIPQNKSEVDPLYCVYPEEWHYNSNPFVTHQRRSFNKSFNQTEYSINWIKEVRKYIKENYQIEV